ncbi:MAG: hypothetical protein V4725_17890 [Bacteroidota bacterium]|nr:hypothetical protein [Ferruginibacter sp.]
MPNESRFEVEFTREQIEQLLANPELKYLNVSGSYVHTGENVWTMQAEGYGTDSKKDRTSAPSAAPCIKPC